MGFRYFAIGLLFLGITNTITVFFQALGKGTKALLMSISRQGLFFIPAILILPSLLGLSGVLVAQPVADVLSALMGILLFLPYLKKEGIEKLFQKTHQDSQV
ncbi:MAG: MATE family efflux transporter, partial [Bacilli bacterium]|nr:MATE family efflux transporter [Bacilli bacterium]